MLLSIRKFRGHIDIEIAAALGAAFLIIVTTMLCRIWSSQFVTNNISSGITIVWFLLMFGSTIIVAHKALRGMVADEPFGDREMPVRKFGPYFFTRVPGHINFWIIKQTIVKINGKPEYATYQHKDTNHRSLCVLVQLLYEDVRRKWNIVLPQTGVGIQLPHLAGCDEVVGCGKTRETREEYRFKKVLHYRNN